VNVLKDRTRIVETQFGKIADSQGLIIGKFAGKPKPNLVPDLKMMRSSVDDDDMPEELNNINAPTRDYTVEDLAKIFTLKNSDR
jgi:hypothetical protein